MDNEKPEMAVDELFKHLIKPNIVRIPTKQDLINQMMWEILDIVYPPRFGGAMSGDVDLLEALKCLKAKLLWERAEKLDMSRQNE